MRCTGILPYHTCPHHLRWHWFSSLRSGHVSPWSCYRADRSGPASGSGRPGSSCGSRCRTWNQQSSAGTPAEVWFRRKQRETKHRKRERRMVRRHQQVLIVMCAVAFMGAVSKRLSSRGWRLNWELVLWHFIVSHLALNWHILYALHLQADNYVTRCVNEVTVWIKISQNKCKAYNATFSYFVLRQQYSMCPRRSWETCTPFPKASGPLAIIHLKHPDLLHYHQTNICLQAKWGP